MTDQYRFQRVAAGILLLGSLGAGIARADWQLSPAGDPGRQWHVSLTTSAGYDSNIHTASTNKETSSTFAWSPVLEARIPGEQTAGQMRYAYVATYDLDESPLKPEEAHVLDANVSHIFTPRLSASLSDTFRRGIEPSLVGPLITQERGNYYYNLIAASASFQLTSRLTLSLNQSWEKWLFDLKSESVVNDRDGFSTTASAVYQISPRTSAGLNYSYSRTAYSFTSITNAVRDSDSQAIYFSLNHHFKPLVFLQANAGAQLAGFGGGGSDSSPYLSFSATYNFAAKSTLSAGFNYNIQLSELAAYRSSEQMSSYLALTHEFTPRIASSLTLNYIMATYGNLNPIYRNPFDITQTSSVQEDSWQLGLITRYSMNNWASVIFQFTYQEVMSGFDNKITGIRRSFDRMHGDIGVRVAY